jgi:GTPase SAR1 family protein
MEVPKEDLQFKHPFNCLISGPSQCGKTSFIRNVLENHKQTICRLNKNIIKVLWCYGKWQKSYEKPLRNVEFKYLNDMPQEAEVKGFDIVILDDLMSKIEKNPYLATIFTAGTHHDNQSVVVITQNYYQKGEISSTLRKNAHYVMLFKDPGDVSQVKTMSWRMYPEYPNYLVSAYRLATAKPHGYLLIDRTQDTNDICRLRTNIFPGPITGFEPCR